MNVGNDRQTLKATADPDEPITHLLLRSVAAYSDTPVTELPPLREAVEPDALNGIFGQGRDHMTRSEGSVQFPYAGTQITVTAKRSVIVEPRTKLPE